MQKLIDELKLYPGKDQIPTEIADKILAVYQINTEDLNISLKRNWVIKTDVVAGNTKTFTVPAGKVWTIKSAHVKYTNVAVVDNRYMEVVAQDAAGTDIFQAIHGSAMTTGQVWNIDFVQGTAIDGEVHASYFIRYIDFVDDLTLPENCTIKFWDNGNAQPTDTAAVIMIVDEQDA